jgi:hypothetical protein
MAGDGVVRSGGARVKDVDVRRVEFPGMRMLGSGQVGSVGTRRDELVLPRDGGRKEINLPRATRLDERDKSLE